MTMWRRWAPALALALLGGCSARTTIETPPALPPAGAPPCARPLAVDSFRLWIDDVENTPATWFTNLVMERLERSGVVTDLYDPEHAALAPAGSLRASIEVHNRPDDNALVNTPKLLAGALTLYLATAVMPMYVDLEQTMTIRVERLDGRMSERAVHVAASRSMHVPAPAAHELLIEVTTLNAGAIAAWLPVEAGCAPPRYLPR